MRAVVQRVRSAAVYVADETIATIGPGLAVLLGVAADDRPEDGERVAAKILALRIFDDGRGRLDRTLKDAGGSVDVVDLPDVGIKGNSHMMMMDKNSDEIAGMIQKWLVDKKLVD